MKPKRSSSNRPIDADVCLVLEGTYPYVKGGVSTWVHQIITAMPEVTFSLVFIGADRKRRGEKKYEMPENIVDLIEVYLFDEHAPVDPVIKRPRSSKKATRRAHEALWYLFEETPEGEATLETRMQEAMDAFADVAMRDDFEKFFAHPYSWDLLTRFYEARVSEESFSDFFWNAKFILQPLWRLFSVVPRLPENAMYHTVSTGYAGVLAAFASHRFERPMLLSEHGIYVRERISDLLRQEWSPQNQTPSGNRISPLRQLWIEFFVQIGRYAYRSSNEIVSLFQKNADFQAEFGASAERIQIIPNGIQPPSFNAMARERFAIREANPTRRTVGFLGRVVAIKDVKTLLRAARSTLERVSDANFLIVGPTDEETSYFAECQALAASLGIESRIEFTGGKPLAEALPLFDVMVLSSISEGQPFAILESFAAGLPVVATDVGCCEELLNGHPSEHPPLGRAGKVVPPSDPSALADALVSVLLDRNLQDEMGRVGRARVERSYTEEGVVDAYRELYQLGQPEGETLGVIE